MRTFATRSGGFFATTQPAARTFDRIDASTRAHYLLGYYPAVTTWDGKYRKIEVKVNRPGLTVMSRRGYFATDQLVPFDRRQFLTYSRISSAAASGHALRDIKMTIKARQEPGEVVVDVLIDPSRLPMEAVDGVRAGELQLAVFVGGRDEDVVGETWQKVSLALGDASYRRAVDGGIAVTVRVPVKAAPRYVKAVVYDHAADLVGSAAAKLR
jgi:hypothetical protein